MRSKVLVLTFLDDLGKNRRIMINDPLPDVNADQVDGAAKVIVESGVFSAKGLFKEFLSAVLVTTNKMHIVDHRA